MKKQIIEEFRKKGVYISYDRHVKRWRALWLKGGYEHKLWFRPDNIGWEKAIGEMITENIKA